MKEKKVEEDNIFFISRHTIVSFECVYGRGKDRIVSVDNFRVLAILASIIISGSVLKKRRLNGIKSLQWGNIVF